MMDTNTIPVFCECGCGTELKPRSSKLPAQRFCLGHNRRVQPKHAVGFQPGHKFGKGRKLGSRNRSTIAALSVIESNARLLSENILALALAGNVQASMFLVDRLVPKKRSMPITVELSPAIANSVDDLTAQAASLVSQVCSGTISPEDAQAISHILGAQSKAMQLSLIEGKILALEKLLDEKGR